MHKVLQASESKLQAQIAEKEDRLNELSGPLLETKLPDEILLKILGYLSSSDVLRNVARVSKKFKKLSEDPFLIRKIELHKGLLTEDQVKGCLEVLKKSKNLTFFSFDLNWDFDLPGYKIFLKALPTFNNQQQGPRTRAMTRGDRAPPDHQHLEEFCIRGHYWINDEYKEDYISLFRKLIRYLKECSNLKILKIEFEGEVSSDNWYDVDYLEYCPLGLLEYEGIFKRFKFQNLEELHFKGFDCDLENFDPQGFKDIFNMFHENLPKLRRLCFKLDNIDRLEPEHDQFFQEFSSEKNIKIEITGMPVYTSRRISEKGVMIGITDTPVYTTGRVLEMEHPSNGFKIFNPKTK